jgi:hypothetical protein
MQTLKKWRVMTHDQRNEFINEFSVGSIDNSDQPVELFKVEDGILAMDPEDINEPQPFLTIPQLAYFYEWDNDELLDQIEEYRDGITKQTLNEILELISNKHW